MMEKLDELTNDTLFLFAAKHYYNPKFIDAEAFDQEPVAEVIIPQRVPYGAHGSWIQN